MVLTYGLQILNTIYRARDDVSSATGSTVVMSFIAGLLIYRYRSKIKWSFALFVLAGVVSIWLVSIPNGQRFAPLPVAYLTVYLGLFNPPRNKYILSGDYSYGIYLYGFPIQQAFVAASPVFKIWYWHLAAVLPTVTVFALCSWWLVEKPVLGRKDVLKRLEGWYMQHRLVQKYRILQFLAAMPAMRPGMYA